MLCESKWQNINKGPYKLAFPATLPQTQASGGHEHV